MFHHDKQPKFSSVHPKERLYPLEKLLLSRLVKLVTFEISTVLAT